MNLKSLSPCFFGLAFVHMWIYCSTHRPSMTDDISIMVVMYFVLSFALLALFVTTRTGKVPTTRVLLALDTMCGVCMTISAVLLALPTSGLPPVPVTFIAAALGGLGVSWAYARWCDLYAQLDIRVSAPLVLATMALGSVGKTIIDFLPAVPAAIVLACLPAATFACMRQAFDCLSHGQTANNTAAPAPVQYYNSRTIGSLGRIAAGIAIYSFAVGIVQSVLLETMPSYSLSVVFHHGTEIVIALLLLIWVSVLHRRLDLSLTWKIIAALIVTALIFESFIGPTLLNYLLSFVRTAQTVLIIILFLALADIARHSSYSSFTVFAVGWFAYSLPFAIGKLVGDCMIASGVALTAALALIAWILVIVALFVFDESSLGNRLIFAELNDTDDSDSLAQRIGRVQQELAGDVQNYKGYKEASQSPDIKEHTNEKAETDNTQDTAANTSIESLPSAIDLTELRCEKLAADSKLTPREREILLLLAHGRSKTHIAEAFFISENTVRNHVKHIYAKLDVHNRQELLDRVESTDV